jgi:hypothetical protein
MSLPLNILNYERERERERERDSKSCNSQEPAIHLATWDLEDIVQASPSRKKVLKNPS